MGGMPQPGQPMGHHPSNQGMPGPAQPGVTMGQPIHPGMGGPGMPQGSQAGPMMGMMPGGGPPGILAGHPNAHAMQHLNPGQNQMFPNQQMGSECYPLPFPFCSGFLPSRFSAPVLRHFYEMCSRGLSPGRSLILDSMVFTLLFEHVLYLFRSLERKGFNHRPEDEYRR